MAINSVASSSSKRISGLATGMDIDGMVSNLMKVEKIPYNKLLQKKQLSQWRTDSYREITSLLSGFKKDFLDVLSSTNMRSQSTYKVFSASATTNTGETSADVSATAGVEASVGTHTITSVNRAVAQEIKSSAKVTSDILASYNPNWANSNEKNFVLNVDGASKLIQLSGLSDSLTADENKAKIQSAIDSAFGSGKVAVELTGGRISFKTASSGVNKITVGTGSNNALQSLGFDSTYSNYSNRISMGDTLKSVSYKLNQSFNFKSEDTNGDGTNENIVSLTINGKTFKFDENTTVSNMMNKINTDSTANVYMRYDEINDTFKFVAKQTGSGDNIKISEDTSDFLKAINLNGSSASAAATLDNYSNEKFVAVVDGVAKEITINGDFTGDLAGLKAAVKSGIEGAFSGVTVSVSDSAGALGISLSGGGDVLAFGAPASGTNALDKLKISSTNVSGEDAVAIVDGNTIVRSNNTFTVDGVAYTLKGEGNGQQTVSVSMDVDKVYDNITKFVEKYNEVIEKINTKISEEYDRDYQPLTADEKSSMSDDDIKAWETKAKTGLLRNDSTLKSVVDNMRKALSDSVSGMSTALYNIGITTGSWQEKGKLYVDENKLKNAIQSNPDGVMDLFSKQSSTLPSYSRTATASQRSARYSEEGVAQRIFDVIEDNISVLRDSNDNKGFLLEKAGMIGDSSEFDSILYKEIKDYSERISLMGDQLYDKETRYYNRFTQMEKMISQMNAQSSQMLSQLG